MVFSSLTFLLFFLPLTLIGYYILPKQAKNYWLLLMSLIFFAWGAHAFVFIMIAMILINWVLALFIDRSKQVVSRKLLLVIALIINLSVLFFYKYMNFVTQNLHNIFGDSVIVTDIVLPIGISFFTFQAMSYVIDVYRKDSEVQKNPFFLGLYISFFPQLIAGPIVRYRTIADQINDRKSNMPMFCKGVSRFMFGFSEKILLANSLSVVADEAFSVLSNNPSELSVGFAWIGALCYSLQILFDFAGYSSMAIGLGYMFGFHFMENFDYPYMSKSITEFWRRWHISLGQWFRDYVYFPLGGSRVDTKWKLVRNLFIVWLLTGIWHGANWTFVLWGLGYFVLLTFEKLTNIHKRKLPELGSIFYRIFTLLCIMLGWVIFRSDNLHLAFQYILAMIGQTGNIIFDNNFIRYINDYKFILIIAIICCTPLFKNFKELLIEKTHSEKAMNLLSDSCALMLALFSISSLVMGGNNPFIYFNF